MVSRLGPANPYALLGDIQSAANTDQSFRYAVLVALRSMMIGGGESTAQSDWKEGLVASTETLLQAAVVGKIYRVRSVLLLGDATSPTFKFGKKLGAAATASMSPTWSNLNDRGFSINDNPFGWFKTGSGEALYAVTGAGAGALDLVYTWDLVDG